MSSDKCRRIFLNSIPTPWWDACTTSPLILIGSGNPSMANCSIIFSPTNIGLRVSIKAPLWLIFRILSEYMRSKVEYFTGIRHVFRGARVSPINNCCPFFRSAFRYISLKFKMSLTKFEIVRSYCFNIMYTHKKAVKADSNEVELLFYLC